MVVESEKSRRLSRQPEMTSYRKRSAVKLEVEDYSEEEHGSFSKRSRGFPSFPQQWDMKANAFPIPPSQYNPLDEPSPLGLQLRKSPSLLDLIQMRLSQGGDDSTVAGNEYFKSDIKKESSRSSVASTSIDKLKASNFPAKLLKIGSWEYKSRYEGDLVAKCYFAKHKLVWEVLEGGLKSKIEIQWSDIMAIKANCPDDGIGTLNIVLARQPLFFRETNPQPRKHTLWQATSDFTDGQASLHRQHFLECSQGMLNKHFEKLIQCDMRLNFLSRQPEMVLDSPFFESRPSIFEDPGEIKTRIQVVSSKRSTFLGFQGLASPTGARSPSFETEKGDLGSVASEHVSREAPSPSSVMDTHAMEGNGMGKAVDSRRARNWDEIKLPGLHPSMSMSDLMNHIGHRLSEQTTFGNTLFSENGSEYHEILEDIAQYLLSDTQFTTTSDEKSVMSRVNSLCCLLQKDPSTITNGESCFDQDTNAKDVQLIHKLEATYNNNNKNGDNNNETKPSEVNDDDDTRDVSTSKQPTGLSRKDSYGELLLHLPRITSLPKFLFNIFPFLVLKNRILSSVFIFLALQATKNLCMICCKRINIKRSWHIRRKQDQWSSHLIS